MKFYLKILLFAFMLGALCDAKSIFGKLLGMKNDSMYLKDRLDRILLNTPKQNTNSSTQKQANTMDKLKNLLKIHIYYEPVYMADGYIKYVPQDTNKNHHFLG